jgi:DNA transformation protein and related proteins
MALVAASKGYLEFVHERLAPLGEITSRRMFGGHCFYCDGVVFALLAGNDLYLKADDLTRARFESRGLMAFRPFEDHNVKISYYSPPPEFFEDGDALEEWGRAAVEAGVRAAARKTKRRSSSKKTQDAKAPRRRGSLRGPAPPPRRRVR